MSADNPKNVLIRLLADAKQFSSELLGAESSLQKFSSKSTAIGKDAMMMGAKVSAGVTLPLAFAGKKIYDFAVDTGESLSKVNVIFGDSAKEIEKWSKGTATSIGTSQNEALAAVGTYGNLFRSFGVGEKAATKMSKSLVETAADLASFNNTSVDDALQALQSGLSGETEPLKKFGVALTDVRLKDEAVRLGLIKTNKEALTPGAKSQAAYALIMKDSKLAQGDFARTSDQNANSQRILIAKIKDMASALGQSLIPIVKTVIDFVSGLVGKFNGLSDGTKKIIVIVGLVIAAIGPLITIFGAVMTAIGFVTSTVGIWVIAIVALIAIFVYLYKTNEGFRDLVAKVWAKIKEIFTNTIDALIEGWKKVQPIIEKVLTAVGQAVSSFIEGFSQAWAKLSPLIMPAIKEIGKVISDNLLPALQTLWNVVSTKVVPALQKIWEKISPILLPALKFIGIIIGGTIVIAFLAMVKVIKIAIQIVSKIIEVFAWIIEKTAPILVGIIGSIVNTFKFLVEAFKIGWAAIVVVWNAISAVISFAWNTVIKPIFDLVWAYITNVLIPVWTKIFEVASVVWDGIWKAVQTAWNFISPILQAVWDYIVNTLVPAFQKIWDKVSSVFTSVKDTIGGVATWIKEKFEAVKGFITKLIDNFKEIPDKIKELFSDAKNWLVDMGKNIIQGLIDGAGKLLKKLGEYFLDLVPGWIKGAFKSALGINSPSKVFMGYGENIIAGLLVGLDQQNEVERRMQSISNGVKKFDAQMALTYAQNTGNRVIMVGKMEVTSLNPSLEVGLAMKESLDEVERIYS